MIDWNDVQKRYLDPYSIKELSVDSKDFNGPLIELFNLNMGVVKDTTVQKSGSNIVTVFPGLICMKDTFIQFTKRVDVNTTDTFFYHVPREGVVNSEGWYPLVVHYKYERVLIYKSMARLQILKDPAEEYDKDTMVVISNLHIAADGELLEFQDVNPNNVQLNRRVIQFDSELISDSLTNGDYTLDGGSASS